MELNEVFKNGANKGQTLEEVWRGSNKNLALPFVQETLLLISDKIDKYQKMYCPIYNDDAVDNDFFYLMDNSNLFEIICTKEYIILESDKPNIIEKLRRVIRSILEGSYDTFRNRFFTTYPHNISTSLDCKELRISECLRYKQNEYIISCNQIIDNKSLNVFVMVDLGFFKNLEVYHQIKQLKVDDIFTMDIEYPKLNKIDFNIEMNLTTEPNDPIGFGLKLNKVDDTYEFPQTNTNNGEPLYILKKVVFGEAKHKLHFDIRPNFEAPLSEGFNAILKMIGKPNYIQYCMQHWDDFFISIEDLNYLMTKHKPLKMSMEVNEIAHNVLSYKPILEEYDFQIPEHILQINASKLE